MKKIIAMSMSLVLMAGIFTGCSREPGKKDTLRRLEDVCGGENIEIVNDGRARSLDRDLEFTYRYDWEGTPIWPDINMGGKYHLDTEDQRLQLDNVRIAHTDSSDPRDEEYGFGRAKIYVN